MPIDYKQYPTNWKWLSRQVRKRNGGCCELCCAPNGYTVYRWTKENREYHKGYPWYFSPLWKDDTKTRIVLTVHHIDGDKQNNSEQNLISLCQKCHLRLDLAKHMKNRKAGKAKG